MTTDTTPAKPSFDWSTIAHEEAPSLKPPATEADVPETVRAAAEAAYEGKNIRRVVLSSEDMVKAFLKHLGVYAKVRKAGKVSIRATVQPVTQDEAGNDVHAVHYKVSDPITRSASEAPADNIGK